MKPPFETNDGDPQGDALDGARSARSRSESAVVESAPSGNEGAVGRDLGAWLDALDVEGSTPHDVEGEPSCRALREADELSLVLAEVNRERRGLGHSSAVVRRVARDAGPGVHRFDARALAERLLAESQQHAILEAAPADLLAAQLGTDALSEELLARLLEGIVSGPFGTDELAVRGSTERGLLALLALQLYVHEARSRVRRKEPEEAPAPEPEPSVVRDARLLEMLAVPHEGSRPLGERRPRGRPRR